jgi:hypothetical protein
MTKRGALTDRSRSILADSKDGLSPAQIASRWGVKEMQVRTIIANLRRLGHLPPLSDAEADAELDRKEQVRRAQKERERGRYIVSNEPLSIFESKEVKMRQCLAHWRDLDLHHPSGWPSYRIEPDSYVTNIRPSMAHSMSLTGSPAAMAAEASGR